jgi:hypothetical protein
LSWNERLLPQAICQRPHWHGKEKIAKQPNGFAGRPAFTILVTTMWNCGVLPRQVCLEAERIDLHRVLSALQTSTWRSKVQQFFASLSA